MSTHNIPTQVTPFVGRIEELNEIASLLADSECRLLTLVGPGGIGKTRLALEASGHTREYPNGIYFIPLQSLSSPDTIVPAIADALNIQFYPAVEPKQQLLNYLRKRHLLLILDNFEHLLDGVNLISDILTDAPHVQIMVTSRERLNLSSETVFNVRGMSVPDHETADNLLDYSSVKLFVQAVRRLRPNFKLTAADSPEVARICRLVDGMPLALLMAAAWVEMLPLEDIADEIAHNLDFLEVEMHDLPERHRSIRATFDYSWRQLSNDERDVFKRLSIFRGGFTREAAQTIAGASLKTLKGLVNKSFVQAAPDGRYDLHELLRQYGEDKLNESPEAYRQARDAHCHWYAAFCDQRGDEIRGSQEDEALDAIEIELENIRIAWDWAVIHHNWKACWQLFFAFHHFLFIRNRHQEGVSALEQALTRLEQLGQEDELQFTLQQFQTLHYRHLNLYDRYQEVAHKCLKLLNGLENRSLRHETALAIAYLGWEMARLGNLTEHKRLAKTSITVCRANRYAFALGITLVSQVDVYLSDSFPAYWLDIQPLMHELLNLARELDNNHLLTFHKIFIAMLALRQKDYTQAKRLWHEIYPQVERIDNKSHIGTSLAEALLELGEYEESKRYCLEVLRSLREAGTYFNLVGCLFVTARVLAAMGEKAWAAELAAMHLYRFDDQRTKETVGPFLNALEADLPSEVFAAAVERGQARDPESAADELLAEVNRKEQKSNSVTMPQRLIDPLTERERKVLCLIAEGHSNRDIAKMLFLALGTVKRYVSDIYSKLGVGSRIQAVIRARELNLLP